MPEQPRPPQRRPPQRRKPLPSEIVVAIVSTVGVVIAALIGIIPTILKNDSSATPTVLPTAPLIITPNTPVNITVTTNSPLPTAIIPATVVTPLVPTIRPTEQPITIDKVIRVEISSGCNNYVYNGDISNLENKVITSAQIINGQIGAGQPICISPFYDIDITSLSGDEEVKIPDFIVVDLINSQPLSNDDIFNVIQTHTGGYGVPDFFYTMLSPTRKGQFAAPVFLGFSGTDPNTLTDRLDQHGFFTLRPEERESFRLLVSCIAGYQYNFRFGIYYTYKGDKYIKWSDSLDIYGMTPIARYWDYLTKLAYIEQKKYINIEQEQVWLQSSVKQSAEAESQNPAFKLPYSP